MPTTKRFAVSIDEVRQNFVFGDIFTDTYKASVKMSDGAIREIALRPVVRDGELVVEFKDGEHVSYMGLNSSATHGALMITLTHREE